MSFCKDRKPEVLSPCGSIEALKGAVNSGADAVYIGGRKFGARAYADNPERDVLLDAIDFVHLNGKKIYMTVNTLLKEDELEKELYPELLPYYERGLDAVIVQDIGVMDFIRNAFPDLHIHASTQLTITGSYGAEFLKKHFGITRVVPARELSLSEIKSLREETDLELECFVHGALCYSYSGQCLMSSMIGGRSGNRGRCAQPCRMKYDLLENGKTSASGYLISLKDMCTMEILPDLIDAGIDSFKIEGRMKRPEYTAGITAAYRYLTDLYLSLGREGYEKELTEHPEILSDCITRAKELYNRGGFSKGYYLKLHGKDMMCPDRPNHTGIPVGKVVSNNLGFIRIKPVMPLSKGDVLEIQGKDTFEFTVGQEGLLRMQEDKNGYYSVNAPRALDIARDSEVLRTKNAGLLSDIEDKYLKKDCKGAVSGILRAIPEEPLSLTCEIFGCSVTVTGNVVSPAQSKPSSAEDMEAVLRKTGESIFDFSTIRTETTGDAFVPVGALKSIRREAFEKLKTLVIESFLRTAEPLRSADSSQKTEAVGDRIAKRKGKTIFYVSTCEQLDAVAEEVSPSEAELWLDLCEEDLTEQLKKYCEVEKKGYQCYLVLPHIFRKKDALRYEKELDLKNTRVIINSFDELGFVMSHCETSDFKLSGQVYVMNKRSEKVLERLCRNDTDIMFTASLELNENELKKLDISGLIFPVYGRIPLMYTAQCLRDNYLSCLKTGNGKNTDIAIRDQKNACFPVRTACSTCLNIIYNSKIYSLLTYNESENYCFSDLNAGVHLISFTFESPEETKEVIRAFRESKELNGKDYTRGTFYRLVE